MLCPVPQFTSDAPLGITAESLSLKVKLLQWGDDDSAGQLHRLHTGTRSVSYHPTSTNEALSQTDDDHCRRPICLAWFVSFRPHPAICRCRSFFLFTRTLTPILVTPQVAGVALGKKLSARPCTTQRFKKALTPLFFCGQPFNIPHNGVCSFSRGSCCLQWRQPFHVPVHGWR